MNRAALITIEKAAAAKIFFECRYNELLSNTVTPRALRRRELEGALYEDVTSSSLRKEMQRRAWARRETDHLRELHTAKSRTRTPECCDQMASMYEVVKVLGKGSFGVVRLVREKVTDRFVSQGISIRFREATNGDEVPLEILKRNRRKFTQ
jgi:protein-serine/threonine kinase